jgi:hypothetical protein
MIVTEILKDNLDQEYQLSLEMKNELIFKNIPLFDNYLLWYADPFLGNDSEISKYTTAVVTQRLCRQVCFHERNSCTAETEYNNNRKSCLLRCPNRDVIGRTSLELAESSSAGGFKYLYGSPRSRWRRRKGNPVPGAITGQSSSMGGYTHKYRNLALHAGGVSNLRQ